MHLIPLASLSIVSLPVPGSEPWHVLADAPAIVAMTDFRDRPSVTIDGSLGVDTAIERMKYAGVRSAFVTDVSERVVGLVTAYDLIGEKPLRHMRLVGAAREDVAVRDLMVPVSAWEAISIRHVEQSTMADVSILLSQHALTHVPVMETRGDGSVAVRGLISAARVSRILGTDHHVGLDPSDARKTA